MLIELERAGNARDAAATLGVSQSTLTQALARLESDYGTKLFDRGRQGSRPTPTGVVVIDAAQRALAALDTARREVTLLGALEDDVLTIGCEPSLVDVCAIPTVVALIDEVGARQFQVRGGTARSLVEALRAGDVDVYVGPAPDEPVNDLDVTRAGSLAMVPFCRRDHPLVALDTPGVVALRDYTLAMTRLPDWYYRRLFTDLPFDQLALVDLMGNARSLEMDDFGGVKCAIQTTDAIGLAPRASIAAELANGEFVTLDVLPDEAAVFEPIDIVTATRGDRSDPPLVSIAAERLCDITLEL